MSQTNNINTFYVSGMRWSVCPFKGTQKITFGHKFRELKSSYFLQVIKNIDPECLIYERNLKALKYLDLCQQGGVGC